MTFAWPWPFPDWWADNLWLFLRALRESDLNLALLLRWMLQNLLLTLGVIAVDYAMGAALLRLICRAAGRSLPPALRGAAALCLGGGFAAMMLLGFGLFYRIRPRSVLGLELGMLAAGVAILTLTRAWPWAASPWRSLRVPLRWALVLLVPLLLFTADLMLPVADFDSTSYHMAAARAYKETGRLGFQGGMRFNAQPHLGVLLYLRHWILLGEDTLLKLINLEFLLILAFGLAFAASWIRRRALWLAGLLFVFTSPVFHWVARAEYADLVLSAWFTTGVLLLVHESRSSNFASLWTAAAALALASTTKLQGAVMVALACLAYVAVTRRLRPLTAIAVTAVLCGVPWWQRSLANTGSPAAPFFLKDDKEGRELARVSLRYGHGRDPVALALLPFRMIAGNPNLFADPYVFGPAGLLLLALAAVRRRLPATWRLPALLVLLYFCFWFATGQVMRYLASLLPLMACLAMALYRGRPPGAVLALLAIHAGLTASTMVRLMQVPPVTQAAASQALAESLPYYPAARALNRDSGGLARTYLLFTDETRYHVAGESFGDWFGDYNYDFLRGSASVGEILGRLRGAGFRYLFVDRSRAASAGNLFGPSLASTGLTGRFDPLPGASLLYADNRYSVFRLE
ncbi:MAG: hypothetical protein FJW40_12795 [Acidobacteria bacterium]|nr:hypothetical protein [Acidobacteriota bacterium]